MGKLSKCYFEQELKISGDYSLSSGKIQNQKFVNEDFCDLSLTDVEFINCKFSYCNFENIKVTNRLDFFDCEFRGCTLSFNMDEGNEIIDFDTCCFGKDCRIKNADVATINIRHCLGYDEKEGDDSSQTLLIENTTCYELNIWGCTGLGVDITYCTIKEKVDALRNDFLRFSVYECIVNSIEVWCCRCLKEMMIHWNKFTTLNEMRCAIIAMCDINSLHIGYNKLTEKESKAQCFVSCEFSNIEKCVIMALEEPNIAFLFLGKSELELLQMSDIRYLSRWLVGLDDTNSIKKITYKNKEKQLVTTTMEEFVSQDQNNVFLKTVLKKME